MHQFVLTGVTGLRNRGVEALVQSKAAQILGTSPDARLTLMTQSPEYDVLQVKSPGITPLQDGFRDVARSGIARRLYHRGVTDPTLLGRLVKSYGPACAAIGRASAVVATGGDVFSSDYNNMALHLMPLEQGVRMGRPIIFLGHSIGPFKSQSEVQQWMGMARKSALITARESLTYRYLTEKLGLSKRVVHLTADTAFLLEPAPASDVDNILAHYCLADAPFVSLSISQGISKYAGVSASEHFEAWRSLISQLLDQTELEIALIPHVQETYVSNDDRILGFKLLQALNYHPRLHFINGEYSAAEYKGIISRSRLVVAERMHAAIAGLSSGVCTVVVGYSVKAEGVMLDLLGDDVNKYGLLISIGDFVSSKGAFEKITSALANRREVEGLLEKRIPGVKSKAEDNFRLMFEVL